MSCPNCLEIKLNSCSDAVVDIGPAAADVRVLLSKPGSSKSYQRDYTTNAEGEITLLEADFPEGLFVAGTFLELTAVNVTLDSVAIVFTHEAEEYDCLLLHFVDIDTDED